MDAVSHDASPPKMEQKKADAAWVREPESTDYQPECQPAKADENPPIEEPGYGHGV